MLFRDVFTRIAKAGIMLAALTAAPTAVNAAQNKQCKTWVIVSDQVPVLPIGSIITRQSVTNAKNAASYRAGERWKQWAGATHGQAYANPALANGYKTSCQVNGSPPKSVLCEVMGKPCRVDNASPPGDILNRIPAHRYNRVN